MPNAAPTTRSNTTQQAIWTLLLALYALVCVIALVVYGWILFVEFHLFFAIVIGFSLILDALTLHGYTAYVRQRPCRSYRWKTLYLGVVTLLGLRFALLFFLVLDLEPTGAYSREVSLFSLLITGMVLVGPAMLALYRIATTGQTPQ